jgi:hypothetical protein
VSGWAADALWLGPHICTRLREQLPELREAFVADDLLTQDWTKPPQDPAVMVSLYDMRPPGSDPLQPKALIEQDWLALLVVRSARADLDRARQKLGPLVTKTITAMQGWVPPESRRAFTWRRGPRPDYRQNIYLFPLLFTIQVVST